MSQKKSRSKPKDSQSRGGLLIYSIPTLTRKDKTSNLKGWDPKSEWMELGTWNLKGCNLKLGMMESETQKDVTRNPKGCNLESKRMEHETRNTMVESNKESLFHQDYHKSISLIRIMPKWIQTSSLFPTKTLLQSPNFIKVGLSIVINKGQTPWLLLI